MDLQHSPGHATVDIALPSLSNVMIDTVVPVRLVQMDGHRRKLGEILEALGHWGMKKG